MMTVSAWSGAVAISVVRTRRLTASARGALERHLDTCRREGANAVVLDLSGVGTLTRAGLGALVELTRQASVLDGFHLAMAGLSVSATKLVAATGADLLLPLFPDVGSAMADAAVARCRLAGVKAVALAAGRGTRLAPITDTCPKPMVEFLGRPILDRILQRFLDHGIADVFVNADYRAEAIVGQLELARRHRIHVHYLREDRLGGALGSAGTLRHLQEFNAAFDDNFIVMCGDTIADIDLAGLMDCHRRTGAAATIATRRVSPDAVHKYGIAVTAPDGEIMRFQEKPRAAEAASDLASTGIYVFSPRALEVLPADAPLDIAGDLLPRLLAAGERVQSYEADFTWMDIGAPADLYNASVRALGQIIPGAEPAGVRRPGGIWLGEGARLSRLAAVKGPAFIGAGAVVAAGAALGGPVVIGTGAEISMGARLRHCLVLPGTRVPRGACLDQEIVGPGFRIPVRAKAPATAAPGPEGGVISTVAAGATQGA